MKNQHQMTPQQTAEDKTTMNLVFPKSPTSACRRNVRTQLLSLCVDLGSPQAGPGRTRVLSRGCPSGDLLVNGS